MTAVTVLSPVRNEEGVLEELVRRTANVLNSNVRGGWEFIVVDDASTDSTENVMQGLLKRYPNLAYVRHSERAGQTGCFKTGFERAKGRFIITMDGDLEVQPEDIRLFLEKIKQGYDVINGIREHRKHSFWLRFASRIYNLLMLLLFNCPVLDAASNYSAFRSDLVRGLPLRNNDHRYLLPMVVRRGASNIGEVVVRHNQRTSGKSKYKVTTKFLKGGPEIIRVWIRIKRGIYDIKT